MTHTIQLNDGDSGIVKLLRDQIVIQISEEMDGLIKVRTGNLNEKPITCDCPVHYTQPVWGVRLRSEKERHLNELWEESKQKLNLFKRKSFQRFSIGLKSKKQLNCDSTGFLASTPPDFDSNEFIKQHESESDSQVGTHNTPFSSQSPIS